MKIWEKAEKALADRSNAAAVEYELLPGEGAFYGPRLNIT